MKKLLSIAVLLAGMFAISSVNANECGFVPGGAEGVCVRYLTVNPSDPDEYTNNDMYCDTKASGGINCSTDEPPIWY